MNDFSGLVGWSMDFHMESHVSRCYMDIHVDSHVTGLRCDLVRVEPLLLHLMVQLVVQLVCSLNVPCLSVSVDH